MFKSASLITVITLLAAPTVAHAGNGNGNVKGKFEFDLALGIAGGKELVIREPEMCEGEASAKVKWNQSADKVKVRVDLEGIPYEPSYCFPDEDPSTPYNIYPVCVEDGSWQMWMVTRFFTRTSTWYYDSVSGDLIGNEHDLLAGPPAGSIPVELPAAQMMCSGFFQPNPNTLRAKYTYDYGYDTMLDFLGSPGTLVGVLPFNLFDEDSFWIYYTNEILPMSEAHSWDETLADIDSGFGAIILSTSVEPVPKPASLATHDQLMIGWSEAYPDPFLTPLPPESFDDPDCGTEQISIPFPGGALPV